MQVPGDQNLAQLVQDPRLNHHVIWMTHAADVKVTQLDLQLAHDLFGGQVIRQEGFTDRGIVGFTTFE